VCSDDAYCQITLALVCNCCNDILSDMRLNDRTVVIVVDQ